MTSSVTFFYMEEVFPNIQLDNFLMKTNLTMLSLSSKSLENILSSLFFIADFHMLKFCYLVPNIFYSVLSRSEFFQCSQRSLFLGILLDSLMPFSKCTDNTFFSSPLFVLPEHSVPIFVHIIGMSYPIPIMLVISQQ